MATLTRLFDFAPNTLIQSAQIDQEFAQLVDILSGVSTSKNAIIKFSDGSIPPLTLDQLGAGIIQSWKQNGVEKARVNNDGSIFAAGLEINSASPTITLTDTDGEDFVFSANGDSLAISNLTGPVNFFQLRGGANDDIQVLRPMIVVTAGDLRATRPRFTTSIDDSNGNELFGLIATGSAVNEFTVENAASGNHPKVSTTGTGTNINIDLQPKGAGDTRMLCSIGHGFVAQAIGATDAPLCALANSSGQKNGEFGLALASAHFSSIAAANDFVIRSGGAVAGHMILVAHNGGDIKFSTATVSTDTAKVIITNAGALKINSSATPGTNNKVLVNHSSAPLTDVATSLRASANTIRPLDIVGVDNTGPGLFQAFDDGDVSAARNPKFRVTALGLVESRLSISTTENGELIRHGGVIRTTVGNVDSVGSGETTLHSTTIKANTLNATGDSIEFEAAVFITNNANTKTIRLKFGGNTFLTFSCATSVTRRIVIRGHILRNSSTNCRTSVILIEGESSTLTPTGATQLDLVNFTPGSDQVFSITGQGTSNGDLILTSCTVKFWPGITGLS